MSVKWLTLRCRRVDADPLIHFAKQGRLLAKITLGNLAWQQSLIRIAYPTCNTLLMGITLLINSAHAIGLPDLLEDPLKTKPPILNFGPLLPDGQPIVCPSEVNLSQALALSEAIDLALCNNPQIKQAWAAIKIQAGALGEARSAYLPTSSATYSPQQTQLNYPNSTYNANSITNGQMSYVNFNWRLFDFGGRSANRISANLLLESALASHNAALQKTMASVIQSYFDVLTARATVNAKEQATQHAQLSWQATLRREAKGVSAKSDALQAQTALAKAELDDARARGDYRKALASLVFIMGLPPSNSNLTVQELSERASAQNFKDLASWLTEAEEEHPAIKAAKAQWESAKERVTSARAAGLPTIDFVGNFYQNGYPNQGLQPVKSNTTTVGLALTIPFFEGFATTYKIRGAQAQAEKVQADLEDTTNQILTEIIKSHSDAVSSLTNLQSSQKLLEAANAAVNSSVNRYDKGVADILELLTTQTALVQAQQERIRCIAEWHSARLRLLANAGVLGKQPVGQEGQ